MANVSTNTARGELKTLARLATRTGQTLKAVLGRVMDERHSMVSTGSILIEADGNGSRVKYQIPSDVSPGDYFELCNELDDLHDRSKTGLIAGDEDNGVEAIPSPTDAQILEDMLGFLQPITSVEPDFCGLRL